MILLHAEEPRPGSFFEETHWVELEEAARDGDLDRLNALLDQLRLLASQARGGTQPASWATAHPPGYYQAPPRAEHPRGLAAARAAAPAPAPPAAAQMTIGELRLPASQSSEQQSEQQSVELLLANERQARERAAERRREWAAEMRETQAQEAEARAQLSAERRALWAAEMRETQAQEAEAREQRAAEQRARWEAEMEQLAEREAELRSAEAAVGAELLREWERNFSGVPPPQLLQRHLGTGAGAHVREATSHEAVRRRPAARRPAARRAAETRAAEIRVLRHV